MAIVQTLCTSFKQELLVGTHNFTASTGDVFKIALYTANARLSADTTVYTTTGEITGTGYVAGGVALTNVTPITSGTTAVASFGNPSWTGALTARGALIYNSSKANKAVAVLDFGADKTSTVTFLITMPAASAEAAIVRIA